MAAVGTVLSVAQTLFAALDSPMLNDICSILGHRSELKGLKNTVSTVRSVLLDAETKLDHELLNEAHDWIEKLKYAVYDADDLLDEFTTLAEQKQLLQWGKISNEVRAFFSRFNQLGVAYTMSRGIKKIRKQLDDIARNHTQFGIGLVNNETIRRRNKETCSYVYEQNIIGREDDKRVVIDMLLDANVEENVSFVIVVGIGGLGKTALAQLVYNDQIIKNEFPLRLWACVTDQDPKHFDIKAILCKILESAHGTKNETFEFDWVQSQLQKELNGKKYLLVLDDVWNEDRDECLKLGDFLMGGGKGSRIVVTTRSKKTARVIGNGCTHELQGLSEENSWRLFERMAFDPGQGALNSDLVEIGKEIVRKCANVPLAIRMVGTLLYGESKSKWLAIQRNGWAKMRRGEDDIMHVLKLSYHHLDTHLKSCFSYCAIFPKAYVMSKATLIHLWMAQGYVEPLDEGQSLDDAGEEYFSILLRRCFFQDVETDGYGEILSCKMHDLMHDIAQEVAGNEICAANFITSKMDERTRHVFAAKQECSELSFPQIKVRTYLRGMERNSPPMKSVLRNFKYLRALEFEDSGVKKLPCIIATLLHLRHLDLSYNTELERFPKGITELHNLQTLILSCCSKLKELPSNLSKLVKLRVLDISGCDALTSMPRGIDKLTGLCLLTLFIVAKVNSSRRKQHVGQLKDIEALRNLKGHLTIKIHENATYVKENGKGGFLQNKEHISALSLIWLHEENDEKVDCAKALVEDLQPHPNLKELSLLGYHDVDTPSWAIKDNLETFVPNLVQFRLDDCKGLQDLPLLGRLQFLKYLQISNLPNLTYMENVSATIYEADTRSGTRTTKLSFFPSLEELYLSYLPKLKGWWREDEQIRSCMLLSFPLLSSLSICECPHLTSMPLCPNVTQLKLQDFNERLQIMNLNFEEVYFPCPKLRSLETDDAQYLKSQPMEAFQCLSEMTIYRDKKLKNLSEVKEVFKSCSFSLQILRIDNCLELRILSGALDHLSALQSLTLCMSGSDKINGIPWEALNRSLLHSLRIDFPPEGICHLTSLQSLVIEDCTDIETLPEWIGCLSSLQDLQVFNCWRLKSLPDGIRKLTSLRRFEIWESSLDLRLRCRNPDGQDWPKIQQIPHFVMHH